ncbi:MAG TPA: TfoX/Sxy family protein [Gaiellaceae bacterium]|nr:TfoX/Sxy family protein [Gaiellaceae bacterium]
MAYDEELADRVRVLLADEEGLTERKMFGGLAFMVNGNMACGIVEDELMLRLGAEGAEAALNHPHVREMDFTGRPLTGMVYVGHGGLGDSELRDWVTRATAYARSLPAK